jgi:(p)ppGpp synthase/HD superfamily hydrolase
MANGPLYSERLIDALRVSAQLHAGQRRKGSDIPYLSHLLGTCGIALDYGAGEQEAIAALLHDTIEDVQPTADARAAVAAFGPEVLRIVEGCTDSDTHPKPPWRERKEAYLEHVAVLDGPILLVSAADKLHNSRSIVSDLRRFGDATWDRFKGRRDGSLWYYRALVDAFRAHPAHHAALVDELDRTVSEMESLAG